VTKENIGLGVSDLDLKKEKTSIDLKIEKDDVYGPSLVSEILINKVQKEPVVGLILLPAMYKSYKYVGLLKRLKKNGIKINVIAGRGLAGIVGAVYAKTLSISKVEWLLYQLKNKAKNSKAYSSKWTKVLKEVLVKEFKSSEVQKTKIPFLLPMISKEKKLTFATSGEFRNLLIPHTSLTIKKGSFYLPFFFKQPEYMSMMKSYGVDIVIVANALGEAINLSNSNDYLYGVFSNIITQNMALGMESGIYLDLSDENKHDFIANASKLINEGYKKSETLLENVIGEIKKWKDLNNR
jgi:hypothetical protein